MTIYADILVITNLYLDFFLLLAVKKCLGLGVTTKRLVLGALVGAFCALFALFPQLPGPLALGLGLATACLTTCAAFVPMKPWLYCKATAVYWAFSFVLAGFFLFILTFFSPGNLAVFGGVVYVNLSPPLLFIGTLVAYGFFWLSQKLFPKGSPLSRYCALTVRHLGKEAVLFAKADTGNNLREPFSGLPVVIVQSKALGDCAPPEVLDFLQAPSSLSPGGLRLVPFEALGGKGLLPAFRPEAVLAGKAKTPLNCYIALTDKTLSAGQFSALWNPDLF